MVAACLGVPASAMAVFPGVNDRILFVSGIGQADNDDSDADLFVNQLGDLTFTEGEALAPGFTGQRRHPNWSPNGQKIVFALKPTGQDGDLYIHNVGDGSTVPMNLTANVNDDRPAWSPDGVRIAYESETVNGQEQEILIFNTKQPPSATNPVNLTQTDNVYEGKPVWSPDGQFIYYAQGPTLGSGISLENIVRQPANAPGTAATSIVATGELEYQPALSPDGTQMCYTRGPVGSNADIYVTTTTPGSGSGSDLSDTTVGGFNCAWSPDGTRIAWVDGTFTTGALVDEPSNDTLADGVALVNDTANHFDGNPDYAREQENCDGKPANVIGTDNDDTTTVNGFAFKDVIQTNAGNDTANGKADKDRVCGKAGNDDLKGGSSNDTLIGGAGKDDLNGGPGKDKCFGNGGNDDFKGCEKEDQ
jgi:Tol biopolymer transport system component